MGSLLAGVRDYPVSLCKTSLRTESAYELSVLDCLIVRSSNVTDPCNDTARLVDGLLAVLFLGLLMPLPTGPRDGLPAGLSKLFVLFTGDRDILCRVPSLAGSLVSDDDIAPVSTL